MPYFALASCVGIVATIPVVQIGSKVDEDSSEQSEHIASSGELLRQ